MLPLLLQTQAQFIKHISICIRGGQNVTCVPHAAFLFYFGLVACLAKAPVEESDNSSQVFVLTSTMEQLYILDEHKYTFLWAPPFPSLRFHPQSTLGLLFRSESPGSWGPWTSKHHMWFRGSVSLATPYRSVCAALQLVKYYFLIKLGFWRERSVCPQISNHTYHHMLSTEDDPKRQKHRIENSLTNISKEQHPRPVKSNRKPLYWDIYERHGDPKSKDNSEKGGEPFKAFFNFR